MNDVTLYARVKHLHATEKVWNSTIGVVPGEGEIIVYDPDDNISYARFKLGDGVHDVNDLPFAADAAVQDYFGSRNSDTILYFDAGRVGQQ